MLPDRVGGQALVDDLLEARQVRGLDVDVVDTVGPLLHVLNGIAATDQEMARIHAQADL